MATGTAEGRADAKRLEKKYPGNGGMTISPLAADLANVRRREASHNQVPWILGVNAPVLDKRLELANEMGFDRSKKEDRDQYSKLIMESIDSEKRAKELAAYRVFEMTSDVMATQFALGAFQSINLSGDELPGIMTPRSRNNQRFTVRTVAQDGGTREDQIRTTKSFASYEVEMLSTDKVEYPLIDIQQGEVEGVDTVNRELQYDMEMKIDSLAQTNIDAASTASGLRDLLNIHPLIQTANIPDTNTLDLEALALVEGDGAASGVWTVGKLKILLDHIAKFGVVGGDGVGESLSLQSIVVSPQNIRDPWNFVDLVSPGDGTVHPLANTRDTVPTGVRESIYSSGMMSSAWGFNWSWLPNGRIAKGYGYALMSQPIGWFFTKTEFDRMIKWEGPDEIEENYGQVLFRRCVKFLIPDLWKHRIVIFTL